jgi:hypothetical protein
MAAIQDDRVAAIFLWSISAMAALISLQEDIPFILL